MSHVPRLSRSKSKSPQHSHHSSPKRKPLHERSNSETNSIAGSASTGPPPIWKDDSDPVYSSSPFPRLQSQVLIPRAGAPFVFEDNTASAANDENAGPSSSRPHRISKPRSLTGKGKGRRSPRSSPRASVEATRSRPSSIASRYGPGPQRDLTRPLDEIRRPPFTLARSTSRVRSMVSAIEASSVKSQSPPPTPRTRSRGSRASITSRRYDIGSREAQAILEEIAPSLNTASDPLSFSSTHEAPTLNRALPTFDQATVSQPELSDKSTQPRQPTAYRMVSEEVPPSASSDRYEQRPRSSSAPIAPTDAFLAALISDGTAIEYPTLERPSAASLRTDTSSFRQAAPHPLQLRRQPGRSNLAVAQPTAVDPSGFYDGEYLADSRLSVATSYEPPGTPPRQIRTDSSATGKWTPGRWDAEMEDDVPELQSHALRAQRSYREPRAESRSDLRRSESVTSFQSASSTSLPFYHFLNDSKTAWARAYYRGEGALLMMTPPHVTMIRSLSARSAARTPPSVHSRSTSDPTDTPDSATYAQDVFIPRLRPFRNQPHEPQRRLPSTQIRHDEEEDEEEDDRVSVATVGYPHRNPQPGPSSYDRESWRASNEIEDREVYGTYLPEQEQRQLPPLPLPEPQSPGEPIPYLSPDRGNDDRISVWRPPSIEAQSLFGTVNRQILLFCIGFCFPFGKYSRSFLRKHIC